MWSIFKKMNAIWFRIVSGPDTLNGRKMPDGLVLELRRLDKVQTIKIREETVRQMIDWLLQVYPRGPADVTRILRSVPFNSNLANTQEPKNDNPS